LTFFFSFFFRVLLSMAGKPASSPELRSAQQQRRGSVFLPKLVGLAFAILVVGGIGGAEAGHNKGGGLSISEPPSYPVRRGIHAAASSELTGVMGRRLSVPTSNLLSAYNAAAVGDTIELEAGTDFVPSATLVLTKAVTIQCLADTNAICTLGGSDDKRIIIVNSGNSITSEFKGLIMTKGYKNGVGNGGGAIFIRL
jgi:hypothetical protein